MRDWDDPSVIVNLTHPRHSQPALLDPDKLVSSGAAHIDGNATCRAWKLRKPAREKRM
jgi:hypothetical protein